MNVQLILFVAAAAVFAIDAFHLVKSENVNIDWKSLGACLLIIAIWLV